jgi:hypothetical protein
LDIEAVRAAIAPANGPPLRVAVFKPTPAQFRQYAPAGPYWPERAVVAKMSGAAVLQCAIAASGGLTTCTVLAEAPQTFGFGAASLKMAQVGYLTAQPTPEARDGDLGRIVVMFQDPHLHVRQ